ncbi:MAG: AsmA family protein [Pseudomonadota bacterium]
MKWIFRLFGLIVVLALTAVGAIFLIPADRIAAIAADQIRTATGREVAISGDVSMTIWPVLGVTAGGIEVGNADWAKDGPMLTAQNAAIGVDAAALLGGEIRITNIEAASPTIRLEQKQDGRASWQFTDASGEAQIETETAPDRPARAFSIEKLSVKDATLIYDAEGSDLVSYSGVDLLLDWPERLGPADITAKLVPAAQDVRVNATIGAFSGFITGQVQPVEATIDTEGGQITLSGRASTAGEVAGQLGLKIDNTDAFLRALGLPGADLPRGLGRNLNGQTELTLTGDRQLALRNLSLRMDENQINGAMDASLNGTPQINAQFNAGNLDLTGLTGDDASGTAAPATPSSGWSRDPIDVSGLAAFNGEIALRADTIDLGRFKLGTTRTLLRNDNSRMVTELREITAYGGTVTGQFVMNNRSGLSVGGNINVSDIQLEKVLSDAIGSDRLTGAARAEVSFLGVGGSADAIMRSLSGQGAMQVGTGTIKGLDLDRLMRGGSAGGGTTIFNSLGATFTMEGGNLMNDDLLFALTNYEARGAGRVGLGSQDIDYLFTPVALRANEGQGLAIPVRIRGPWASPSILPDLDAAIDLNFAAEKERLEQEAKEKVRQKVEEKLGVTAGEGQSLEDAAKDKVEGEIKRGLRSLFD